MVTPQLSTGRSIAVLAVVIGCFAILWPKLFLPLFRESTSLNPKTVSSEKDMSMIHPRLKQLMQESNNNMNVIRTQTSRPFPTMGPRHAKTVPQKQGAMGFVMPLYTIGIIVFFLYTILKLAVRGNDTEETEVEKAPPFPDPRILAKTEIDTNLCKLLFAEDYKKEMVKQFKHNCRMFFDETRRLNEKKHKSPTHNNRKAEDEKDLEIKELRRMLAEKERLMKNILKQNDVETENHLTSNNVQNEKSDNNFNDVSESEDEIETSHSCDTPQETENTDYNQEEETSDSNEEFESETEKQSSAQDSWTPLFTEE